MFICIFVFYVCCSQHYDLFPLKKYIMNYSNLGIIFFWLTLNLMCIMQLTNYNDPNTYGNYSDWAIAVSKVVLSPWNRVKASISQKDEP